MNRLNIPFLASLCVALVACGSHAPDEATSKAVPAAAAESKPSFAGCFTLEPGTSYSMTHDTEVTISNATFNGKAVIAVNSVSEGVKNAEYYEPQGHNALVGTESFVVTASGGDSDKPDETLAFSEPRVFPADVQPGATFEVIVPKATKIEHGTGESTERAQDKSAFTFVGFEDVQIDDTQGKISNACHLQAKDGDQVRNLWYAAGLGAIRFNLSQGEMLIMSDQITSVPKKAG